jgi:hypothetical protein
MRVKAPKQQQSTYPVTDLLQISNAEKPQEQARQQ